MNKQTKRQKNADKRGIRISVNNPEKSHLVRDIFPLLMTKGEYRDFWDSSGFRQAYQLSEHIKQSASLLKKHLPERYHLSVRFNQHPDTWVLCVADEQTATEMTALLQRCYHQVSDGHLPRHLKLRRVYRDFERAGTPLNMFKPSRGQHMARLIESIPDALQSQVRLAYRPSIWQLIVDNSAIATQLNLLLDELSMRLAKDMGFAPKLKVSVNPAHWQTSGFALHELVKRSIPMLDEAEAEAYINDFLAGKDN